MTDIHTFMKEMFINEAKAALLSRSAGSSGGTGNDGNDETAEAISISTSEEMDAVLVEENIGNIYVYTGETNDKYTNGMLYQVIEEE